MDKRCCIDELERLYKELDSFRYNGPHRLAWDTGVDDGLNNAQTAIQKRITKLKELSQ